MTIMTPKRGFGAFWVPWDFKKFNNFGRYPPTIPSGQDLGQKNDNLRARPKGTILATPILTQSAISWLILGGNISKVLHS